MLEIRNKSTLQRGIVTRALVNIDEVTCHDEVQLHLHSVTHAPATSKSYARSAAFQHPRRILITFLDLLSAAKDSRLNIDSDHLRSLAQQGRDLTSNCANDSSGRFISAPAISTTQRCHLCICTVALTR